MWKLYKRSYLAQCRWIRRHPVQFVVLNVAPLIAYFGWTWWVDRDIDKWSTPQPFNDGSES